MQNVAQSTDNVGGDNVDSMKGADRQFDEGVGEEANIYQHRFSADEETKRRITWEVLCRQFLQPYIGEHDTVVDIGAGDGHFLKNIRAKRRVAVDLGAHVVELRAFGIEVLQTPATKLVDDFQGQADIVFMSNFLEHLPNKRMMLDVLKQCRKILKPGGQLLILQPNIRYVGNSYWDYIDHHIALTEYSLAEALETSGFHIVRMFPRFLPYTAKSRFMSWLPAGILPSLVSWYLRLPLVWQLLGKQTFVVATPLGQGETEIRT